jgi:isochorismate hydrolase
MGKERLWVCGVVTEGCVELTARDAADKGYFVTLVSDACASSRRTAHVDAVQRITDGNVIKDRTVDQLIESSGTRTASSRAQAKSTSDKDHLKWPSSDIASSAVSA